MKVHEGQGVNLREMTKNKPAKAGSDRVFQHIMDEIEIRKDIETPSGVKGTGEPVPPGGVQILGPVENTGEDFTETRRNQILQHIDEALDLVDFYAAKLADRSLSIEGLDSLVNHLEERLDGLRGLETVPGLPGGLKSILEETNLTIGTEVAKFRRGDYL